VINTDISPVVVGQMRDDMASWPDAFARANCSWQVADCRCMPQYGDQCFSAVLDKGTLDAVLCCGTGLGDARSYISEAHRLLAPGGSFVLISLGAPEARLAVLRAQPRRRRPSSADAATGPGLRTPAPPAPPSTLASRLAARVAEAAEAAEDAAAAALAAGSGRRAVRWGRVLVYFLPKPSLYLQNEAQIQGRALPAADASGSPRRAVGKDEPVAWLGPYEVGPELDAALSAPGMDTRDFFFAYACTKPGGELPRARRRSSLGGEGAAAAAARALAAMGAPPPPLGRSASFSGDAANAGGAAPPPAVQ
jgi:hypothetical protein